MWMIIWLLIGMVAWVISSMWIIWVESQFRIWQFKLEMKRKKGVSDERENSTKDH